MQFMAEQYISLRNLQFLIHEVFEVSGLRQYDYFKDYDAEACDMILESAKQIGDQYLFPIFREMDKKKAFFEDGVVKVHPQLKAAITAIADGGWIGADRTYEEGGQQMPHSLMAAGNYIFYAANANAAAYAFLTQGAANLIRHFANPALQEHYLPHLYAGRWQGTMALTEPQAGSSLSDITTSAVPVDDNIYKISGQKIYISGGDYEQAENVVHLLLARIKGAPVGTKGISLFVVPKYREQADQLVSNGVTTAGLFGKMGQKGYVAAHLMLGEQEDCYGYLVGEANQGLKYMFLMMNEARIGTGLMASGTATAAYYAALQYTKERSQGRHPSSKDPTTPQVLIIEHADVKRMLLCQKSIVEGSISLLIQCSYYSDLLHVGTEPEKQRAKLLLELLTPIAKTFPSEMGTLAVTMGMQCLGGAGYTDDFPLEQYYRDIRVNAIYEGTTGIQSIDLLGRKVMMEKGLALRYFMEELQQTIATATSIKPLEAAAQQLQIASKALHQATLHLIKVAMEEEAEVMLADATLYLEYFSHVVVAWQWLLQGIKAVQAMNQQRDQATQDFYLGKQAAMQYYFEYELPKTMGLHQRLMSNNRITLVVTASEIN